jgi:LacI family transcriptional regulator, galactose operon repressor
VKKKPRARATLKDLAREVGVHVSTVSRALDPRTVHPITPELTEKIRRVGRRLGYQPNVAASSLKTNRSRTIGVVVPDITDPVFPPIIRGIEDRLGRSDYVAILANTDGDPRRHQKVLEAMRGRGIDGLILASVTRQDDVASQLTAGLPVVTVSRQTDDPLFSSVVHDEDDGMRRVLTHLVSLGHRKIAHIAGPQTVSTGYNRHSSYRRHHKELLGSREVSPLVVFAKAFNEAEGERCAEELLISGRSFTAAVCANDRLATGALGAFRRHAIRCPDDISVTGFNDMPLADRLSPPLTTVRVQHYKAGIEAAELMLELLDQAPAEGPARQLVMPVELIVRGSTGPAPGHTNSMRAASVQDGVLA